MQALIWVGAVLAVLGLAGLAWCIREGLRLRSPDRAPEEIRTRLRKLNAVNFASVGTGFIGLALVAVGVILG
ncbi:hypothetical protein P2H44_25060 [Albimonas sp. CAU 1670]|uniref:hypothetical protein n=1 Tax=Albimonas sp. CAU 1670 TaxID=3032599 RepID=UPI0023DC1649|nr:hypothetical protein [Albimonas sp. CAU 1670]MDF2235836.1 hypothetical protein [Albimonas sp. CAU 1670]